MAGPKTGSAPPDELGVDDDMVSVASNMKKVKSIKIDKSKIRFLKEPTNNKAAAPKSTASDLPSVSASSESITQKLKAKLKEKLQEQMEL